MIDLSAPRKSPSLEALNQSETQVAVARWNAVREVAVALTSPAQDSTPQPCGSPCGVQDQYGKDRLQERRYDQVTRERSDNEKVCEVAETYSLGCKEVDVSTHFSTAFAIGGTRREVGRGDYVPAVLISSRANICQASSDLCEDG